MRIKSIIPLCGLAGLILLAGCSSHSNNGVVAGSNAPVPDNATVKLIQDAINADPALKGASITVKVENNRLTLMGTVQSTAQSEQAMMDASKVQTNNNLPIGAYNMLTIQGR